MASSPIFKVYDSSGVYQAACKEPEAAAALCAFYGNGSLIKYGHSFIVWHEGYERVSANESYDQVALTIYARIKTHSYDMAG